MSKIGKTPVALPAGVTVKVDGSTVSVDGKLGKLSYTLPAGVTAEVKGQEVVVGCDNPSNRKTHGFWGLARTLVHNMVVGVSKGYEKKLLIEGVGFKAAVSGESVSLSLGFAEPKVYTIPEGAKVAASQDGLTVTVTGIDKQLVGRVAADLRSYYPAEPYKGKGVKYVGEVIRRKQGKKMA